MGVERRQFDIGIVIPLKEEFRYIAEIAPRLESIPHQGTYFYRLDFGAHSAVCCLAGQMGLLPALQAVARLLEFTEVKLLVVLGLAGALDNDVAVGDVVVASEVNEYQASSKAQSAGEGYEIRYSGRSWQLEYKIREAIGHFEFSGGDAFNRWQNQASSDYAALKIPDKERICPCLPSLHIGPIASGNVVAASSAFVDELKRINRKFVAIDMEAAGVALAATDRIHPIPCLVVRGMSDQANEEKKTLDEQDNGAWRRYCVRNAASFLRNLLTWDGFLHASGLNTIQGSTGGKGVANELVVRLKSCVGGPWIVGVAFGLYFHGPHVAAGEKVVPIDLSRLRVLDAKVEKLVTSANQLREELRVHGDLQLATDEFVKLVEEFRNQLGSVEANSLLQDFDRVVAEILCPESEDEEVEAVLLEANRLEEEVGQEAVIELLGGLASRQPRLRERYVEALANAKMWSDVTKTIRDVENTQLSRVELEHGLFAFAKTGLFDCAKKMIRQHQSKYDDTAARLFRREVSRQHPELGKDTSGGKT